MEKASQLSELAIPTAAVLAVVPDTLVGIRFVCQGI